MRKMTKFKKGQSVFVINTQRVMEVVIKSMNTNKNPNHSIEYIMDNGAKYFEDEIGTTRDELKEIFFGE